MTLRMMAMAAESMEKEGVVAGSKRKGKKGA